MIALKVTQVGNSAGVILPKEALSELGVQRGDTLYLTRSPDGAMRISAYNEEVVRQIEVGERVMDEYREVFRALAK